MRWFIFMVLLFDFSLGKIFQKCELAAELKFKHKFSLDDVKNFVCIAEYESTFNTEVINRFNWDGSKDYGLFQLNNRYWCGNEYGSNVCNIPCEALLDEDLTDDIACAKRIVRDTKKWMETENGFVAWVAHVKQCQYKNLDEYIQECSEELSASPIAELVEPATEVPAEISEIIEEQQPIEHSTTPPRASGFEVAKPPTKADGTSESESTPPRASGMGSGDSQSIDISDQNMKPEKSDADKMPAEDKDKAPAPEAAASDQVPSRASGLGSASSPAVDTSDTDANTNVISLENIPIRASGLGGSAGISDEKADLLATPIKSSDLDKGEEDDEGDDKLLSSSNALQQAIKNLEILQQDLATSMRENQQASNYEPPSMLDDFYSPHFTEFLPREPLEIDDQYTYEPLSDSDTSVIQFLQEHGRIPMFESRLPTYEDSDFQEPSRPYSSTSDIFETLTEGSEATDPFSVRYDQAQIRYNPDFAPKKAFSLFNPFSSNIKNIFKPFPIFNFASNNDKTTVTVDKPTTTDTQSFSGFNFIKPLLVPQLDFKPININIKKLIKPIKIPIHYPKVNVIKETLQPTVHEISIPKPEFRPFEIGLKKVIKPIPIPTFVKKPIQFPQLEFKPVNIAFLKPTIDKFSFWKHDQPKERTLYEEDFY